MEEQIILAVDEEGQFLEYIPKKAGHTGLGKRHLAIAVILENSKGQILLQKRKHQIFDNLWDITGATHPLHKQTGDETLEEATRRCLIEEWGIRGIRDLREAGVFNYFAPYHPVPSGTGQGEFCENEHCYLLVGQYDGAIDLNPKMGYEYKWIDKNQFLKDLNSQPQNFTPWAVKSAEILVADSTS